MIEKDVITREKHFLDILLSLYNIVLNVILPYF